MLCDVSRIPCAILIGLLLASKAPAEVIQFTATLDGAQADACDGTGSTGTGSGSVALDTDTGVVSYDIAFTGLGSPENAAHVHGPADECVSADFDIVYGLPPGSPKVGTSPPLTAQQQADMIAGRHYVNIHSENFPNGEIRGQLLQVGDIPTISEWGLAAMALLVLGAGTLVIGTRRATKGSLTRSG